MIQIGKTIYNLLSSDADVTGIVGDRIYPLIADVSTTFPFIVYRKNNYQPEYTKDGISSKWATIEIVIASDKYNEGVELAEKAFQAISKNRYFRLENNTEDFIEDTFIQNLIFNIRK